MARTVCSSLRSTASCASTMMLFTPNWSMKLIISFWAPAVMESMATTAPTPKIMPSMVRRLRSLCAKRLASPIFNSGMICEPTMLLAPRNGAHRPAAARLLFALAVLVRFLRGRIGHRDDLARLHAARQHHRRFALLHQLHLARLELPVPRLHEDRVLAVFLKHSLRRNVQRVGNLLDDDLHIRQQPRPQQGLYLRILLRRK